MIDHLFFKTTSSETSPFSFILPFKQPPDQGRCSLQSKRSASTLFFSVVMHQLAVLVICLTEKANRLKAAKKEADTEINNYKAERERQYKEYEARVSSPSYFL